MTDKALVPVEPTREMIEAAEAAITEGAWATPPTSGCGKCHLTAYKAMLAAAPHSELAALEKQAECEWTCTDPDYNEYQSGCGELWVFMNGGLADNRFRYCHGCGLRIRSDEDG